MINHGQSNIRVRSVSSIAAFLVLRCTRNDVAIAVLKYALVSFGMHDYALHCISKVSGICKHVKQASV